MTARRVTYPRLGDSVRQLQEANREQLERTAARPFKPFGEPTDVRTGTFVADLGFVNRIDPQPGQVTVLLPPIAEEDVATSVLLVCARDSTNGFIVQTMDASATIEGLSEVKNVVSFGAMALMAVLQNQWIMLWSTPKIWLTSDGSLVTSLTNKTGADSVKGTIVEASTSYSRSFEVTDADDVAPIGAVYESGVADGDECLLAIGGQVQVLLEDSSAASMGYWVKCSDTQAGRADASNAAPPGGTFPAVQDHMSEIGHAGEDVVAGTDKLLWMIWHTN